MPQAASPAPGTRKPTLHDYWLAEAVRLREAHWSPLADQAATSVALQQGHDLQTRILIRARSLAADTGLEQQLRLWAQGARWSLLLLFLLAFLAGAGTAASALGLTGQTVNLGPALMALLGLHAISLLIWLLSLIPGRQESSALSRAWLWLAKRLVRGPDSVLAAQALLSLLRRSHAWKPLLGVISHGAWTAACLGALPTLIVLLGTRQYSFHWETTLLTANTLAGIISYMGSLPHALGFQLPAAADIAASVGRPAASASLQTAWSIWLIGCVVSWGLLPRALGLFGCLYWLWRRFTGMAIDPALPGWLELRARLQPAAINLGVDKPATRQAIHKKTSSGHASLTGHAAVLGHEIGEDLPWPPAGLPEEVMDLGRCNSRDERATVRTGLLDPPAHLLLVCDARLTPDRGTISWFDELQKLCPNISVFCMGGTPERRQAWQDTLARHGYQQVSGLAQWLAYIRDPQHG